MHIVGLSEEADALFDCKAAKDTQKFRFVLVQLRRIGDIDIAGAAEDDYAVIYVNGRRSGPIVERFIFCPHIRLDSKLKGEKI